VLPLLVLLLFEVFLLELEVVLSHYCLVSSVCIISFLVVIIDD
jgi:hypothetical protein